MTLSSESVKKLLALLRAHMLDESVRRGYLMQALGMNTPVLNKLVFNQPADTFITSMLWELISFGEITPGKPALCALLEVIRKDVGEDVKLGINELLQQVKVELTKQQPSESTWKCVRTLKEHSDRVTSVAISPDGRMLASGSVDTTIKLWDLFTGKLLHSFEKHSNGAVSSLAFSPDGKTLASGSCHMLLGKIQLWDLNKLTLQQTFDKDSQLIQRVMSIAFSPDGKTLATGHTFDGISLWDVNTGKLLHTLRAHGLDVFIVTFSPDGWILASAGGDGAIIFWDWRTTERVRTFTRPSDLVTSFVSFWADKNRSVYSIAISPDGKIIASGGKCQPVELWNADTGQLVRILTGHSGKVFSVAFSPDGQILASAGEDNTIKIWNYRAGDLLCTFEHSDSVKCITFSPDAKTLVSGSHDTTIKIWRLHSA